MPCPQHTQSLPQTALLPSTTCWPSAVGTSRLTSPRPAPPPLSSELACQWWSRLGLKPTCGITRRGKPTARACLTTGRWFLGTHLTSALATAGLGGGKKGEPVHMVWGGSNCRGGKGEPVHMMNCVWKLMDALAVCVAIACRHHARITTSGALCCGH